MKYMDIESTDEGMALDPGAYLCRLASFADSLPRGARRFATAPDHYDFVGPRCVKDLRPAQLTSGETAGSRWLELHLRHNCWKHEEDLTIHYSDVQHFSVEPAEHGRDVAALGSVVLDEVLPDDCGCRHEIVCLSGTLTVTSGDLSATWRYAECPER